MATLSGGRAAVRCPAARLVLASARRAERADAVEGGAEPVFLELEVVAGLEVHPESFRGAEVAGEPQRGVGGDAPLAVDDLIDPPTPDRKSTRLNSSHLVI